MYGLIHKAMREMIISDFGADAWENVSARAKVPEDSYLAMESYEDSTTFAIAGAISEALDTPLDQCLELFGEFWMSRFAPQNYEMLLRASGNKLFDFLENLDGLHDRITATFIGYSPPSFRLQRESDLRATLTYSSVRSGLTPFVIGLLKGMQKRFDTPITIESVEVTQRQEGDQAIIKLSVQEN